MNHGYGNYVDLSDANANTEEDANVTASAEIIDTKKRSGPRVGAGNIEYSNEVLDEKEKCILIFILTFE